MIIARFVRSVGITVAAWVAIAALATWGLAGTVAASSMLESLKAFAGRGDYGGAALALWSEPVILQAALIGGGLILLYQLCLIYLLILLNELGPERSSA